MKGHIEHPIFFLEPAHADQGDGAPPLSQSRVAQAFAWTMGFCSGRMVTDEERRMRGAEVATNDSAATECK